MLSFDLLSGPGQGLAGPRTGVLALDHGPVRTPAFMPVGTAGAVKAVGWDDVEKAGAEIVLANTYHLMLRPGGDLIRRLGGLHRFVGWQRPVLTDSGGFQVLSLAAQRKVREDGVLFRSHLDGSEHLLSPERAAELQVRDFGVDVAMVLDECPPHPSTREEARRSMELTHRWARRGRDAFLAAREGGRSSQFGIVQGGMYEDLRAESASVLSAMGFEGMACGGLSVGEPKELMRRMVEVTAPLLPADRPRYLMGVGRPDDLVHAVAAGFDMFDCVLPTRAARHGLLFTSEGPLVLKNARYREDARPLDEACGCPTCRRHSRAYLRHLLLLNEPSAAVHLTRHNLSAVLDLMRGIRDALASGRFGALAASVGSRYASGKGSP